MNKQNTEHSFIVKKKSATNKNVSAETTGSQYFLNCSQRQQKVTLKTFKKGKKGNIQHIIWTAKSL
jgi:hypothetical protein